MSTKPKKDWDKMRRDLQAWEKKHPRPPGMPHDHYILNEKGEAVPSSFTDWVIWFEGSHKQRIVKQEWIGDVHVSTIFLSLNHSWFSKGPPILWETMTFSNNKDFHQDQDRCAGTREQAVAMHAKMCAKVRARLKRKAKP